MFPESYIKDIRWAMQVSNNINSIARLEMLVVTHTPFVPPEEFRKYAYGGYDTHEKWVTVPNVYLSTKEWEKKE